MKKLFKLRKKKVAWIPKCRLVTKQTLVINHAKLSASSSIKQDQASLRFKAITTLILRIKRVILLPLKISKLNATWNKFKRN